MSNRTCKVYDQVGLPMPECKTCGLGKAPHGRDVAAAMAGSYCTWQCPGYDEEPEPGELWPGERYGNSLGHMNWHEEVDR